MKRTILLVALIAVAVFLSKRMLKGDGGSVETEETIDEMTNAEDASEGDASAEEASDADGQADIESQAEDATVSEVAG